MPANYRALRPSGRAVEVIVRWTGAYWQARIESVGLAGFGATMVDAAAAITAQLARHGYAVPQASPDDVPRALELRDRPAPGSSRGGS